MRTDLLIVWPAAAPPDRTRRMVWSKVLHHSLDETVRVGVGLEQTRAYTDRGAASEGHLAISTARTASHGTKRSSAAGETAASVPITVWGM